MRIKFLNIVFVSLVVVLNSCVNNNLEKQKPSTMVDQSSKICEEKLPDSISFKRDLIPVFVTNCANESCHSGYKPERNLNLEASQAYTQITKPSGGYINIKSPERSVLYNSLTSPSNLMPPSGQIHSCNIDLIVKWMGQGALNN